MRVTVLHNIGRDAGLGINQVLTGESKRYEARSHGLVRVFEFDAAELRDDAAELPPSALADIIFRALNVGHEPGYAESTQEYDLAVKYRTRRLRSLSKGDVLAFEGGHVLACESVGWFAYDEGDLWLVPTSLAENLVRVRYQFQPGEELTITVPLPTEGLSNAASPSAPS